MQWALEAGSKVQGRLYWVRGHERPIRDSGLQGILRNIPSKTIAIYTTMYSLRLLLCFIKLSVLEIDCGWQLWRAHHVPCRSPILWSWLVFHRILCMWIWLISKVSLISRPIPHYSIIREPEIGHGSETMILYYATCHEFFVLVREWRCWLVWKTRSPAISQRICTEGKAQWRISLSFGHWEYSPLMQGFNQLSELALMTKRDFEGIVMDVDHVRRLEQGAKLLREKRNRKKYSLRSSYLQYSLCLRLSSKEHEMGSTASS